MNSLSTIAAAVATALQSAALGQSFSVQRAYVPPDYDSAAESDLKLIVVAADEDVDLFGPSSTRAQCDHVYGIRVAMVKRVAAADVTSADALSELDALSDFREALIDFLKSHRAMGNALLDSLKNSPAAYDPPSLDQKKTFVSVVALTYRLLR